MFLNGRTSVISIISGRLLAGKSSVTISRHRDLYWSCLYLILVLGIARSKLWRVLFQL